MDAFRKQKMFLRFLAIPLPNDLSSRWLRIVVDLYFWAQVLTLFYWSFLYFQGAYLYIQEEFLNRVEGMALGISVYGSIAKLVAFKLNCPLLEEMFGQLGDFLADTKRGIFVRKVTSFFEITVAAILVTHNYQYFFLEAPTRSSPYYSRTQTGPAGEVAVDYWLTLYSAAITLLANVIGDTLFLIITNQICHRLLLLSRNMASIGENRLEGQKTPGVDSNKDIIKACVDEHNTLITLKNKLEHLYNYIILVQLVYSFSTICITLFVFSQFGNLYETLQELLPQTISLFLEIFLYCWAGQMLSNHFEALRFSVYDCPWFDDWSPEDKSSLLIMQTITTVPVTVTSVSVFHLNYHLYEVICREAFSYYTIMSQLFSE